MDKKATHAIKKEVDGGFCVQSGVYGALNKKITTKLNKFGQYEADISKLSVKELDELSQVSSMSNLQLDETKLGQKLFGDTVDIKHNEIIGYYMDLYAGYVTTGDYRSQGSSGGIATWLLDKLLEKKLIDGVIHMTPANVNNDGVLFRYSISSTHEELRSGAKSRYYPGDLSEVLRVAKESGGRYAITGIPSFITELRLLAEYDDAFRKTISFTIGLVCGHQKSAKYVEALAWQHGIKPGNLISADFRKKVSNELAYRYTSEFTGKINGETKIITKKQNDLFASEWGHGMFKSLFSDYTDDAFNELADITLGDAWLEEYAKDSKGTNIVIVRNSIIANILSEGLKNNELSLDELSSEKIIKSQSGLVHHNKDELPYRLAKKDSEKSWRPVSRAVPSSHISPLRKYVQDIREEISTSSHIRYYEAVKRNDWNYYEKSMKTLVLKYSIAYKLIRLQKLVHKGPSYIIKKAIEKIKNLFSSK